APRATSAGPGQNPASPQPTPKTTLPATRRRSIVRAVGSIIGVPRSVTLRLAATANPARPTAFAPAITSASEGSQRPAMSRNPRTFAGFAMPETMRPKPNSRPVTKARSAYIVSASEDVTDDEHGREACSHERERGREGSRRQPRQAAHTVATRAARAIARADADDQSRDDQRRIARDDDDLGKGRVGRIEQRRGDEAGEERDAPCGVRERRPQQSADDTADARDAPVREREQHAGDADDDAARQCRPRRERGPV